MFLYGLCRRFFFFPILYACACSLFTTNWIIYFTFHLPSSVASIEQFLYYYSFFFSNALPPNTRKKIFFFSLFRTCNRPLFGARTEMKKRYKKCLNELNKNNWIWIFDLKNNKVNKKKKKSKKELWSRQLKSIRKIPIKVFKVLHDHSIYFAFAFVFPFAWINQTHYVVVWMSMDVRKF